MFKWWQIHWLELKLKKVFYFLFFWSMSSFLKGFRFDPDCSTLLKQSALYWLDTYLRLFMEMLRDFYNVRNMYQWKFVSMQKFFFFIVRSFFFFSYDDKWKKSTSVFQIFLHVTISCSSLKTTQEVIVLVVIKLHHKCMCASHRPWVEETVFCRSTNIYIYKKTQNF